MADNAKDLSVTLPDELRRQFAEVQRRLWLVESSVALAIMTGGLLLSLIVLFISDRFWNTPVALRMVIFTLGLTVVGVAFYRWGRRWLWGRRTQMDLANIVQKKFRRLGDRLLGIVELAQEQHHQANFSPALYHAAIHQVADEARQYDFRESVNTQPGRRFGLAATAVIAVWIVFALILPAASWNSFLRWMQPMANIPRYTLVGLEGLPRELIVPHGEPFAISGKVAYRSFWKPTRVVGQLPSLPGIEGIIDDDRIHVQIPGQVEKSVLRVRVGDAVAQINIVPVLRPSLRALTAQIQLPDYLKYPDQTQTVQSGSLSAVEGSRIAFQAKTSRTLAAASMKREGGPSSTLKVAGDSFSTPPAQPDGITDYIFGWQDDLGLSNAAPLHLSVAMQKDAPPIPNLADLPRDTAILAGDVMHIRVSAGDDFGVRDLGLTWDLAADAPLAEGYTSEVKVMPSTTHEKKAEHTFLWSPQVFRLPADSTVELQGFARDFFPDRERARTATYRVRILSAQEHAELMREQLQSVMEKMEDVTRLQEKIAANLNDLKTSDKLPDAQKSARAEQSKNDQMENSAHLNELSEQAARTVKEAMKNPLFPADTIRQWNQSAQQWQQLAQNKMKDAASSMQSAQKSSPSQSQKMEEAAQKAQDILDQLQKMQNRANEHMDQLQALTLSERLRKISDKEKEISTQLIKTAPDTVGLPPDELPDKFKKADVALTTDQTRTRKESDTIQGEINRFFERTKKTNYGVVSQEMKTRRASDELDRLGGMIGDNIAIQASANLNAWSEQYQKWSDELQPKEQSNPPSGQGSSSKSKSKDLTEQLIALLRLREGEFNLRDQTTVLDQEKGQPDSYKSRASALAETQDKMAGQLAQVKTKVEIPDLDPVFAQSDSAMQEVSKLLLTPETGKPADDAQIKTVDSLSDLINLINEQAKRGKPQQQQQSGGQSTAEEMAFLMRLMQKSKDGKAMALQPATGLNHAGGTTSQAGHSVSGSMNGRGAATRNVDKASGVMENSPAEFRDALDNYFHGIEHSKN